MATEVGRAHTTLPSTHKTQKCPLGSEFVSQHSLSYTDTGSPWFTDPQKHLDVACLGQGFTSILSGGGHGRLLARYPGSCLLVLCSPCIDWTRFLTVSGRTLSAAHFSMSWGGIWL